MRYIGLQRVNSDGSYVELPDFQSLTFDCIWGPDPSTISFTYPAAASVALGLHPGKFVTVSPDGVLNGDYYVIESAQNVTVTDDGLVKSFRGRSLLALLEDDFVWPSAWPSATPTGHGFINSSAGTILRTLIDRSYLRGTLKDSTSGLPLIDDRYFTGVTDSASTPWAILADRQYNTGQTLLQVLQDLNAMGMIDIRMSGFIMMAYNAGTAEVHKTEDQVAFRAALNIIDENQEENAGDFASDVLAEGDGFASAATNGAVYNLIGRRRATYTSGGGIANAGVLSVLASTELGMRTHVQAEQSLGVAHTEGQPQPFADYRPGDWVWVDRGEYAKQEIQIKQISVQQDLTGEIRVGLSLGDLLDSADAKLKRRVDAITGGNAGNYGGLPNTPPVGSDINYPPGTPQGLIVGWYSYVDENGLNQSTAILTWNPVTTNQDGSPATDIAQYEVMVDQANGPLGSVDDGTRVWVSKAMTEPPITTAHIGPFAHLTWWRFVVVAIDTLGVRSFKSAELLSGVPGDTIAPDAPLFRQEDLVPVLGGLGVNWNGQMVGGLEAPSDLRWVEVHAGPTAGFVPVRYGTETRIGVLYQAGFIIDPATVMTVMRWYCLIAEDTSGNRSVKSAVWGGVPHQIVEIDMMPGSLTEAAFVGTVRASLGMIFIDDFSDASRWVAS